MNPKVALIYIDSGGGHRAAAEALLEIVRRQARPWTVESHSIQQMLDPIDFMRALTGVPFQDVYNIMLRKGWTLGTGETIPLMHGLIRLTHSAQVKAITEHWRRIQPDMVVSLIPHYNRALKQSLETLRPGTPFVTLLTDIADYPPHFWIERMDQDVICGSEKAERQALEIGVSRDRVHRTSGMILHPRFYERLELHRGAGRLQRGLRADLPTALVLFGGEGSTDMLAVARSLNQSGPDLQAILLCGRNEAVASALHKMEWRIPHAILGFTREIPRLMELADVFIGKPGPGSISEALVKGLPVIVPRNAWTLAHERYNADWVEREGFGIVVRNLSEVGGAARTLLSPQRHGEFQGRVQAHRNRAVFEIPGILEQVLRRSSQIRSWDTLHPGNWPGQSLLETSRWV